MIGETNVNGYSGLTGKSALLKIKAQTGSIVAVCNGEDHPITLTKKNIDNGNPAWSWWLFETDEMTTWTVYADKTGFDGKAIDVDVNERKEYEIIIIPNYYLLYEGNTRVAWKTINTTKTSGNGYISLTIPAGGTSAYCTNEKVDFSLYNYLYFDLMNVDVTATNYKIGFTVTNSNSAYTNFYSPNSGRAPTDCIQNNQYTSNTITQNNRMTIKIPLTEVSQVGEHFIGVAWRVGTINFYNIYLGET